MKLYLYGVEIDAKTEVQLSINFDYGIDVHVEHLDGTEEIFHNCSNFHHLFNRIETKFESEIHDDGAAKNLDDVKWISVVKSKKKYDTF